MDFVEGRTEVITTNRYLLKSTQIKLGALLKKNNIEYEDTLDALLSLHLVLELSLNEFYRNLALEQWLNGVDWRDVVHNIDRVSFIDKTITFIYFSRFVIPKPNKAFEYHKIINKLRAFAEIRNQLVHGHGIIKHTDMESQQVKGTKAYQNITEEKLHSQLRDFVYIMKGMKFYLECIQMEAYKGRPTNKSKYTYKTYLDYSFIPKKHTDQQ